MRLEQPTCPECGEPASGLWEAVPHIIAIRPIEARNTTGEWEDDQDENAYDEVFWDSGWNIDDKDHLIPRGDAGVQLFCGEHSWMTRRVHDVPTEGTQCSCAGVGKGGSL